MRCVQATCTAPTAGRVCLSRSSCGIRARFCVSTFRADAAFAMPRSTSASKLSGVQVCRSAFRPTRFFQNRIGYLLKRPVGRPPNEVPAVLRQFHLSGGKLDQAAPGDCQSRVASGRACSARRLHRHQHEPSPPSGSSPSTTNAGRCEQWIKEGKGVIKWTRLSCRSFTANAVRSSSFMRSPTTFAISCARSQRRSRSRSPWGEWIATSALAE